MTHRLTALFIALATTLTLAACAPHADDSAPPPAVTDDHGVLRVPDKSPLRQALSIAPVDVRTAPHARVFPAMVEADPARTANIVAPLAGRVTELKVGLGDRVERHQLLAVIESGDMAQAYADVAKATDALVLAKKGLDRARAVQQAGGNATKDLEAAQGNYDQARAEETRAQARLTSLNVATATAASRSMRIVAPMNGYVTALSTAPGTYVNDTTTPLMTVADTDSVWISVDVPESDIGGIAPGQAVDARLSAYPDQVFHGKIAFVSPVLQADTRRDRVRAAFANADGRLKPNMFAKASIAVPQPAQVFVPASALLMNNDDTTVFVEVSPWVFARRTVELGYEEGEGVRVLKGLKAGDRVVVKGGVLLND